VVILWYIKKKVFWFVFFPQVYEVKGAFGLRVLTSFTFSFFFFFQLFDYLSKAVVCAGVQ
jgi:hypothetical protein